MTVINCFFVKILCVWSWFSVISVNVLKANMQINKPSTPKSKQTNKKPPNKRTDKMQHKNNKKNR